MWKKVRIGGKIIISIRTDLAIEAKQAYTEENKRELDGVKVDEENEGDIKVTTVTIEVMKQVRS